MEEFKKNIHTRTDVKVFRAYFETFS